MENPELEGLLKKFLEGTCDPQELKQVLELLEQPEAVRVLHHLMEDKWLAKMLLPIEANTEGKAMHRLKARMRRRMALQEIRPATFFMRYAAVLLLPLLGLAVWWALRVSLPVPAETVLMAEQHNPYGQRSRILLPDSTVVYLGAASSLRYPKQFKQGSRQVYLRGEAFFEIARRVGQPFTVSSSGIDVRVLGTSFKVSAFDGKAISVRVATGRVQVERHQRQPENITQPLALLSAGQSVDLDPQTGKPSIGFYPIDALENWKLGNLVFRKASLQEMSEDLERWYHIHFVFSRPERIKEEVSGVIPAHVSVRQALDVLGTVGHFSYTLRDSTVIIH